MKRGKYRSHVIASLAEGALDAFDCQGCLLLLRKRSHRRGAEPPKAEAPAAAPAAPAAAAPAPKLPAYFTATS